MADLPFVGEGSNKERDAAANHASKPEIKLEFDQSFTSRVPGGHLLRTENLFLCPLTPRRKTVEHVVDRLKEELKIPGNLYMKTMDGVVLMPDYPAENLPSYGKVQLRRHEDWFKMVQPVVPQGRDVTVVTHRVFNGDDSNFDEY